MRALFSSSFPRQDHQDSTSIKRNTQSPGTGLEKPLTRHNPQNTHHRPLTTRTSPVRHKIKRVCCKTPSVSQNHSNMCSSIQSPSKLKNRLISICDIPCSHLACAGTTFPMFLLIQQARQSARHCAGCCTYLGVHGRLCHNGTAALPRRVPSLGPQHLVPLLAYTNHAANYKHTNSVHSRQASSSESSHWPGSHLCSPVFSGSFSVVSCIKQY